MKKKFNVMSKVESIVEGNFVTVENFEVEDILLQLKFEYNINILRIEINDFDEMIISLQD